MNIHRLEYRIALICLIGFTNGALATEVMSKIEDGTVKSNALIEGKRAEAGTGPRLEYHLGFAWDRVSGKMLFTLDNQPYLPVAHMVPFQQITQGFLNSIKCRGCNGLLMQMDATDAESEKLKKTLDLCLDNKIPVIAEVNGWEYWRYLETHLDLNMLMVNWLHVRYDC